MNNHIKIASFISKVAKVLKARDFVVKNKEQIAGTFVDHEGGPITKATRALTKKRN